MNWLRGLAALGLTLLVGCASPAAAPPAATPPAATPAPAQPAGSATQASAGAPAKAATNVTIGFPVENASDAPVHVAVSEGLYAKQGVNVDMKVLAGSSETNAALVGGSLQFATTSTPAFLLARKSGVPIYAVESILSGSSMQLMVSNRWLDAHQLTPDMPLADRVKGLQGITFGTVGSSDKILLQWLLKQQNLPPDAVKMVTLGGSPELTAALTKGTIDAFISSPPASYATQEQGQAKLLIDSVPPWNHLEYFVLITTRDYAQKNPDIVKAVATATAKGNNFVLSNPTRTLAVEQARYPKFSPGVLQQTLAAFKYTKNGTFDASMWDAAVNLFADTGMVQGKIPVVEGTDWTNQFIDQSQLGG